MEDFKHQSIHPPSDKSQTPNLSERAKEEIAHVHHKETHGLRDDIDVKTPLEDVRAPNLFERAKEEVEALIHTIHLKEESSTRGGRGEDREEIHNQQKPMSNLEFPGLVCCFPLSTPLVVHWNFAEIHVETPNFIEKTKQKIEEIIHHEKSPHQHHRETHGTSDDIDENTPIDEVKGPNIFERAKEEIEAVWETILPKKNL
ncbi:hypothetical protein F8388_002023 [Cannabis sativa]|uniref:Uncharacterized protein n=1 Tax=Cannabis sativa TaxID=3483 RepID=A0A7J6FLJ2_CANSA|nr:hypothetical protein F8388_002023 [Cannabis sativa]KAF4391887.1 hypothetical protein G4B88_007462 [Cannabis sativa]